MKKPRKAIRIVIAILGILLIGIFVYIRIMFAQFDPAKVINRINEEGISYHQSYLESSFGMINMVEFGDKTKPKVLFIHGSPGHWTDWEYILTDSGLMKQYHLIAYDRPGFGESTSQAQYDLGAEATIAKEVINYFKTNEESFTIAGHSYGGAVLEQMMIEYSSEISKAIYVAPTINPAFHGKKWYNMAAAFPLVCVFLPRELQNSNKEMWKLAEYLEKCEENLRDFNTPTVFIQGEKDILVPYETANYYRNFDSTDIHFVLPEDLNHFTPWSNPELIIEAIEK